MEQENKKVKKVTLGFILSWILGVLSVVGGLATIFKSPVAGILYLLLAFILLPPANKLVEKKLKFSISGGLKFILFIVLSAIIIANLEGSDVGTKPLSEIDNSPANVQQEINEQPVQIQKETSIKVSAEDLYQEYKDNSVAAGQKYKGKQVEVTGSIDDFGTDIMGRPYITFGFLETQAVFSKSYASQLAELKKGQEIIVQCKASGSPLGYPILESCSIK